MRKSWLTAASALAAVATEAPPASAQLFSAPSSVDFGDTLVGSSTSKTFGVVVLGTVTSGSVSQAVAPFSGGPLSLSGLTKTEVLGTYDFAPAERGGATDLLNVSAINLNAKIQQGAKIALNGIGVAPVESVSTSPPPVGRIGTMGLETVTVSNMGDGNLSGLGGVSDLKGNLGPAKGAFQGTGGSFDLADGSQTSFDYKIGFTDHGTVTGSSVKATFQNGSADGTNQSGNQNVALSGQGVGPVYDSSIVPGVIDLGFIKLGGAGMTDLKISNVSTDPNFGSPALTDLSLLAATVDQAGKPGFSVENFVPDTVLGESDSVTLKIDFSAIKLGMQTADLVIATDQNAAFGQIGATFDYRLSADVVPVPEPQTWEMLLLGFSLVGLQYGAIRRRPAPDGASQDQPPEK